MTPSTLHLKGSLTALNICSYVALSLLFAGAVLSFCLSLPPRDIAYLNFSGLSLHNSPVMFGGIGTWAYC